MSHLNDFSFWTVVMGSFRGSRYLINSSIPYEINVVVDDVGAREIAGAKAKIIMHKAYPSKDDSRLRSRKAIFRECLDYCKTRYMVWIDSDVTIHSSLDFIQNLRDKNFVIAGIPLGIEKTKDGTLGVWLHFGFLVVDTTNNKLGEFIDCWKPYFALTDWSKAGSNPHYVEGYLIQTKILDRVPYILIPMKYIVFPTYKTDVSKETLIHYTRPRRGLYAFLEKGKGEPSRVGDRWKTMKEEVVQLGRKEWLDRWVHVWNDHE